MLDVRGVWPVLGDSDVLGSRLGTHASLGALLAHGRAMTAEERVWILAEV